MADVRKTVEIALKVIGIDFAKLDKLAKTFETISTSADKAKKSIDGLQRSLKTIKPPTNLTKTVQVLEKLGKVKLPSLVALSNSLQKLSLIKQPPKLTTFVTDLKQFANIKLPGIDRIVSGFKKLTAINITGVITKIRSLNKALLDLDKRGGLSVFKKFASDVNHMRNSFNQAAAASAKISTALAKTGNAADKAGLKIRTFGDKVSTIFSFRIISVALQNLQQAMLSGITAIVEYDQALKDLQAITGATTLEVAQMGIKILEVASTTKFSASEVAAGMRTIGQAGFSASEAVETMQAVSDLATGTLSDMATTVDLVTTAMRVFQIDATESGIVADVFANAVNKSKLTVDKLRTAMNYIGPIARDSGVSFTELATSMGTLANSGLRASTIGTGLRRVFAELIDPSKKLKEAAREAGVALNELDPRSSSLADVMQNLNLVVGDAQKAFDLFGKRGASAVLALSSTESRFNEMLTTISRSGTAAQMAAIQMEGLGVSFKNLKDKLGILAIAIGEAGLADAMRLIINLSRTLLDALTMLAGTGIGKLIISFGLLTAAAISLTGVLVALTSIAKIPMFAALIGELKIVVAGFGGASIALRAFMVSLGPVGAAVLAVGAAMLLFGKKTEESADDLLKLADKYAILEKKFQDYEVSTIGLAKGSNELKEVNRKLRASLLETASSYDELSTEANAAAASINPVTGEIGKQSTALDEYNKKLDELRLDKLTQTATEVNRAMDKSGSAVNRLVNRAISDIKNLSLVFDRERHSSLSKGVLSADAFAKAISEGNVSMKEMGEYIQGLDHTKLNTQQEVIIKNYKWINEQSDKFVEYLIKTNSIGLDDTIESIKKTAEEAGFVGIALDAALEKIKLLQEANDGDFSNIIEKWAIGGTEAVVDFIEQYKELGGTFAEGEEAQLRAIALDKQALSARLEIEKEKRQAAEDSGIAIEKTWKDYFIAERKLLQEAAIIRQQESENASGQNIKLIMNERLVLEKELEKFAIMYKNNAELRIKHQEEATRKYLEKEKKLLEGVSIDPAEQKKAYELHLTERQALFAKHLEQIALLEAKGDITAEQAQEDRLNSTVEFYKESYREALKYQSLIDRDTQPEEYDKRHKVVLKAEEAFYKSRVKYLLTYTKEVAKAGKEITKTDEKITNEKEKYADKQEKIAKDTADKILAIDKDYATKKEAINAALAKKLKDIDAKIADNRKSVSNDVLSLESDTEEKIRQIRESGLKGEAKERADKRAADKYLAEGIKLVDAAQRDKDTEQLSRGIDLIRQAEDIGGSLKNQRDAVNFLKKSLEALKDARIVEGGLDEEALLAEKNAEIKLAQDKLDNLYILHTQKIALLEEESQLVLKNEDDRHTKVMKNLDAEIIKSREKLNIAQDKLDDAGGEGGLQGITDEINAENERHKNAVNNTEIETRVIAEKYEKAKEGIKDYELTQEELDMDFDSFFNSLTGAADDAHQEVQDIMEEDIVIHTDNEELEETQEILEEVDNTVLDVLAKVIGKDNVDALRNAIDKLKSKVITITTRYVTQGSPDRKREGGRLPGYGGGDRNPVLAEDGEWFIRKEAVRKYGDAFMSGINNMSLPKFQTGGRVGLPATGDKSSGGVSETLVVRFQAGGVEAPVSISDPSSRSAMKQMANELTKMRLTYAR